MKRMKDTDSNPVSGSYCGSFPYSCASFPHIKGYPEGISCYFTEALTVGR